MLRPGSLLRWIVVCLFCTPSFAQQPTTLSQEQMRDLVRKAAEHDEQNFVKEGQYTYVERDVERHLSGKGDLNSVETRTNDVLVIYGEQVQRLTARNDKPLSAKEAAKEEEKIQKIIDKRKNESEHDRDNRLKKEQKDRVEERQFVEEIADAYTFTLEGLKPFNGRDNYVIHAEPRPGFQPKGKGAKFLPKFRGTFWIDKTDTQWVRLDIECIDTVSIGWVLARVQKGSRIDVEQIRVNDEVWLPQHVGLKLDVRVALFKGFHIDLDQTYSDYKKFRTDTKIVPVGEVEEKK